VTSRFLALNFPPADISSYPYCDPYPQPLPTRAHKGEGSRPSLLLEFYPDGTCYDFVALSEHYCFSMPAFSMTEAHFLISADMRSRI
jgi:hypothetical protein